VETGDSERMNKIRTCRYCKEYYKHDTEDPFKDFICPKCRPKPK
jgi:hydrogenase maturation factor HypF (carbamoyltransferase family)